MPDYYQKSIELHKNSRGKIEITNKSSVVSKEDLAVVYSPGVAHPCLAIQENPELAYDYTIKGNSVAVASDSSAVLGLDTIGPKAAIPVMEGNAMLFKQFGGVEAVPSSCDQAIAKNISSAVANFCSIISDHNQNRI